MAMAADSFFLVIEGLDGAGKSCIARHLFDALTPAHDPAVKLTYEPHDPPPLASTSAMYWPNA